MYVLIAVVVLQTALIGVLAVSAWRAYAGVRSTLVQFVSPAEPGKPSPMAQTLEASADILARAITARMSTAIMTGSSALARAGRAVEGDVIEDLARQTHPAIDGLLSAFPTLRKTLRRNPALLDIGVQAMMRAMDGKGATAQRGAETAQAMLDGLGKVNR
jgi:hypothetical protein